MSKTQSTNDDCTSCVYYPPNLPEQAYSEEDYRMLQQKSCSFDYQPGDDNCHVTRKTHCSLVDLENLKQPTGLRRRLS